MAVSRRFFLRTSAMVAAVVASGSYARASCPPPTRERQASLTPRQALDTLMEGNTRFVAGAMENCNLLEQVRLTSSGQYPIAAVVGCIDSRVPPELIFDQKIGDIFSARVAGNFVNMDIVGSLEFACRIAGAKAIIVLGHTECGAIKGAIDKVELGNLPQMLAQIEPAIAALGQIAVRSSQDNALVQKVADTNARRAAAMILTSSDVLKAMVDADELVVAAAMHDIATGKVSLL